VNINSTDSFNKVVATSTQHAFEIDNVAYNPTAVPEPSSLFLALVGAVGVVACKQMRRKGSVVGEKS